MNKTILTSKSTESRNSSAKKPRFTTLNASDLMIQYDFYDLEVITVNVIQAASGGLNSFTLVA